MKPCEKSCPKCGSSNIFLTYHREGETLTTLDKVKNVFGERFDEFCKAKDYYIEIKKECLVFHCRCCQYGWVGEVYS